jgi:hypothetical protein
MNSYTSWRVHDKIHLTPCIYLSSKYWMSDKDGLSMAGVTGVEGVGCRGVAN